MARKRTTYTKVEVKGMVCDKLNCLIESTNSLKYKEAYYRVREMLAMQSVFVGPLQDLTPIEPCAGTAAEDLNTSYDKEDLEIFVNDAKNVVITLRKFRRTTVQMDLELLNLEAMATYLEKQIPFFSKKLKSSSSDQFDVDPI